MDNIQNQHKTEVGYVLSIIDSLIFLDGLPTAHINDLVENEHGLRGVVTSLLKDQVEVWILDQGEIQIGQIFKKTDQKLSITVGDFLLGRAINPLGVPIDGKGPLSRTRGIRLGLDKDAPGIEHRQFINEQFVTGISLVDTLVPIGKGQRQLVLGDTRSGKHQFLLDVLVNQNKQNVTVVYAFVGRPITTLKSTLSILQETGAFKNAVIVAASSTESPPLIFYTPYTAMTIAEYFARQGKDVLLIIDDLGIHAKVYRELSLLGGRFPGRQAYPGDIFHIHAKLVERAGRFNKTLGGGSITTLPVMEVSSSDFTNLIPTNLMSMTDGHFFFDADLFGQGFNPSIEIAESVSRVGRQTQNSLQNQLSLKVRQIITESAQLETTSSFSTELPPQTRLILMQKEMINEIVKQDSFKFVELRIQMILFGLIFTNFFVGKNGYFMRVNKQAILNFLQDPKLKPFLKTIDSAKNWDELILKLERLGPSLKEICK